MTETTPDATRQPFYLRYWLAITLASLLAAGGTVFLVLSSLEREEGWSVFGQKHSFTLAANLGDQSSDGLWIAAVSNSRTLRPFDPAVILMLTEVDCEAMRYRVTSSITHSDDGGQTVDQPDAPPAWKPVPPASADTIEHPIYQIACHPDDTARQPLSGTPFDLRQTLLEVST